MRLPALSHFIRLRHFLKSFDRLVVAEEQQAHDLHRLADKLCGVEVEEPSVDDLRKLSGVSFARDGEQLRIQQFEDDVFRRLGRQPTEEEVIAYLEGTSA